MDENIIEHLLYNQINIPNKLLADYKKLGLSEHEIMVILQIYRFINEGIDFPTPTELSMHLTMHEKEIATILRKLIQQQFLMIKQIKNDKNKISESYCLKPLWKKLFQQQNAATSTEEQQLEGTIFILFEQEFGRPLSPFEIETISDWLDNDQFSPSLIKAALRESVLMSKLNFTYIDRILRSWKKKGIKTVEQARESSREFREHQVNRTYETDRKKSDSSLYYNWLEGEE